MTKYAPHVMALALIAFPIILVGSLFGFPQEKWGDMVVIALSVAAGFCVIMLVQWLRIRNATRHINVDEANDLGQRPQGYYSKQDYCVLRAAYDPPHELTLFESAGYCRPVPIKAADVGERLVYINFDKFPKKPSVGEIAVIGGCKFLVVDSAQDVTYRCKVILAGQWRRVWVIRLQTWGKNFKRRVSLTRSIWTEKL